MTHHPPRVVAMPHRTDDDADCFGVDDLHHFLQKFANMGTDDALSVVESVDGSLMGDAAAASDGGGGDGESKGADGEGGEVTENNDADESETVVGAQMEQEAEVADSSDSSSDDEE